MRIGQNRIDFLGLDNPGEDQRGGIQLYLAGRRRPTSTSKMSGSSASASAGTRSTRTRRYIFTFNPIDAQHWTWTDLVQTEKPGRIVRLSTYKDNIRNLSPDWIADLLALAEQDENYYRIYALGEPGILQNVIYTKVPDRRLQDPGPGLHRASTLATTTRPRSSASSKLSDRLQVWELLYQSRMTNADVIDWLKARIRISGTSSRASPLYADAAEPNRIEEIKRAGFSARSA